MTKLEDISELLERIADEYSDDPTLSTALKFISHKIEQYKPSCVVPWKGEDNE